MKLQTKTSALVVALALTTSGLVFIPSTATATTPGTSARPNAPAKPKVVRIQSNDKKVSVSDTRFRPGATEFRVTRTAHRGSSLAIIESDNLDKAFKKLGIAFGGDTGSADAMKAFDRLVTLYGGGTEGARWQVKLSRGSYYMLDTKTNNLATFKVKGERRDRKMQHADSSVWTTKDNQFETDGKLEGNWISFENKSREIHFMEADHVANSTTPKDVRQGLTSPGKPEWIRHGGFFFDVQSAGIRTVHFQEVSFSRYLLICFMPSEEQDGVPHAFMGMWHLVNAV